MPDDILHHHYRSIYHHSEVQSAERKQVRWNMAQVQKDRCEQQRERNGQRDDESRPSIEQKQKQNHRYQDHALGEVVHHGVQREVQQVAAIQHRNHLHARRKDAMIQLVDLLVNGFQSRFFVGAFAHQDTALDHVRFVDDAPVLHMVGTRHMAQSNFGALHNVTDVLDPKSRSGLGFQDSLVDVVGTGEESERADIHLLQTDFYETAAGIDVVIGDLLLHLANTQSVGDKLARIHADLILAHGSTEIGNVNNIGYGLELFEQDPIFERPELHQVVPGIRTAQRVPIDLPRRAPVCADLRLQVLSVGKIDLRESFENLLPVPVVYRGVIENKEHERQTENGLRPQIGHVRHAGHLYLDGDGDLLFYLFGGASRPLRDHGHVVVGNVGISFHRQVVE